jgi:hypothetical protein
MFFKDKVPIFCEISLEIVNFFRGFVKKSAILNCKGALYRSLLKKKKSPENNPQGGPIKNGSRA